MKENTLALAAMALAVAAGALAHFTLSGLLLLVLGWRLAPSASWFALASMLFGMAAFPDGGLGYANLYGITRLPLRMSCVALPAIWAFVAFAPAAAAIRWRDHSRAAVRAAASIGGWFLGPLLLGPWMVMHPLLAAGAWFPGLGIVAVALLALFILALCLVAEPATPAVLTIVIVSLAWAAEGEPLPGPNAQVAAISMTAEETRPLRRAPAKRVLALLDHIDAALSRGARTILLPETVVHQGDGTAMAFEAGAQRLAERYGATIWVGIDDRKNGRLRSVLHAVAPRASRLPADIEPALTMPVTMGMPWHGLPGGILSANSRRMDTRVGLLSPLFCYEALSVLAWLERLRGPQPTMVAFVSNQWWAQSPATGNVLQVAARDFARLQGVPLIAAIVQ
ncbi:MAG TPA: hypothetical protein VN878_01965 [Usitatibacter sp.]|nr:hypothetical protein [Usitatibacter sp.]